MTSITMLNKLQYLPLYPLKGTYRRPFRGRGSFLVNLTCKKPMNNRHSEALRVDCVVEAVESPRTFETPRLFPTLIPIKKALSDERDGYSLVYIDSKMIKFSHAMRDYDN